MAGPGIKKKAENLPPLTLTLLVGCTFFVVAFALGVLYPQYKDRETAYEGRLATSLSLEEQKALFPHYAKAMGLAKKSFDPLYEIPQREGLKRKQISELPKILGEIATMNQMEFSGNSLDILNLKKDSTWLIMDVSLGGTLFDFRNYMVALLKLPFFDRMEVVKVESGEAMRQFSTKIWITIEKNENS